MKKDVSESVREIRTRFHSLKTDRSSWDQHWKDLSDYFLPRRSRFFTSDSNKGTKRNDKILHEAPAIAAARLGAGLMAGMTSPARPWFKLTVPDPNLTESASVRVWLYATEERMRDIFHRSNIYNALAQVDEDLGVMGVSALHVDEDPREVIRGYVHPIGSYVLTTNPRGNVNGIIREVRMKAKQIVAKFGLDAAKRASPAVASAYERKDYVAGFDVLQIVEELDIVSPNRMNTMSAWLMKEGPNVFLAEGGYYEFPLMAPRWQVTGEDVYGYSPAMHALPSARALQKLQSRMLRITDYITTPPMVAPPALEEGKASLLPGDVTYVPLGSGGDFKPAYVPDPRVLPALREEIMAHEQRIGQTMYSDLLLMLHYRGPQQMTAREVEERHEEKVLQLGPVMERLEDELLKPLIDRTFGVMMRRRMLPEPIPEELAGMELRVEFVSVLSQAQKLLSTKQLDQFFAMVAGIAQVKPEALDKWDADQTIDEYAKSVGVPPTVVVPDEIVAKVREQRAEQQRAMQAMEAARASRDAATAMKTATETAQMNPEGVDELAAMMQRGTA